MQYLCEKQLTVGGATYYPGEILPDGVIMPERSAKLIRSGYISKVGETRDRESSNETELFTQEQVDRMLSEAVEEAVNNTLAEMGCVQESAAELIALDPPTYQDVIQISVKCESDGEKEQHLMVLAAAEEIQQVFGIMQMNATEGAEAIAGVKSENVLILLHAADTRKTIKDAAKKQADNIFSASGSTNESAGGNTTTGTNTEGVDT